MMISPQQQHPNHSNLPSSSQQQEKNPTFTPIPMRDREKDTCYRCQQQGHWAADCPTTTSSTKSPKKLEQRRQEPPPFLEIYGRRYIRCLLCRCGAPCDSLTSNTDKNPGRQFFCCATKTEPKCKIWKWVDEVKDEEMINVPLCSCGAAPCRISTQTCGPNAGLRVFVCPIKKGYGACNFSQPLDARVMTASNRVDDGISSPRSTVTCCDDASLTKNDLIDEQDFSNQGMEIGSPAVDTFHCPTNCGAVLGQAKRGMELLVQLEDQEDKSNELLQNHSKRLRHGVPEIDGSDFCSATECVNMQHAEVGDFVTDEEIEASILMSEKEIHFRQVEFLRQMSAAEITLPASLASSHSCSSALSTNFVPELVTNATNQNLVCQDHDWWGRLAYSPAWCLINPVPMPFFCCVFPSFDPVVTPNNENLVCGEALTVLSQGPLSPGQDARPTSLVIWEPSGLKNNPRIVPSNTMTTAISEWFAQLAVKIQNKLLSLLESSNFHDHEFMFQEATDTFNALEQLKIDFQPLREKVKEFIDRASSLAEIKSSICNDQLYHELVDKYNREKIQFDETSSAHARAKSDLEVSSKRLRSIGEEASRLREMIFHVEAKLSCCQTQNHNIESKYVHISKEKIESERRLEVAAVAVAEVTKVRQTRERERDAAKAAFKKAKIWLRQ